MATLNPDGSISIEPGETIQWTEGFEIPGKFDPKSIRTISIDRPVTVAPPTREIPE